jgi:hypothetical protein
MNDRQRIERSVNAIELFIKDLSENNTRTFSDHKQTLWMLLFENEQLSEIFKDKLPIELLGKFATEIKSFVLSPFSSLDQYPVYAKLLSEKREILLKYCKTKDLRIFYSWQSDLPNNTNRSFIQTSIQDSIEELNSENNWGLFIDSDTRGECGSPDIVNTILKKIDNSDIVIADVSSIAKFDEKLLPNPNVLFELGYSIKAIGENRIIMVCNIFYGEVDKLPFDLGLKRQVIYSCNSDEQEKAKKREELKKSLKSKIRDIVNSN